MIKDEQPRRHGRIDEVGPLADVNILQLAGSEEGWPPGYLARGYRAGAVSFRRVVERWKFTHLGRVADVGSGFGLWSPFLAEVNDEVIGFERNERGVELGGRLADLFGLANLRFEKADITALASPPAVFDGVWCCNVLHLTDRGKVLSEVNRILRVGGRLAILQYNGAGAVLRKFYDGYARGGLQDYTAQFALRSLMNGPRHNGVANYGDVELSALMLEEFGFTLESSVHAKSQSAEIENAGANDLQALATRLETDEAFLLDFVKRPEFAKAFTANLELVAIKTHGLAPVEGP